MKLLLIIFLLVITIYADNDGHEHHEYKHMSKELSHLKLSKKQNKDITKILKSFRKELREYRKLKQEIDKKRKNAFLKEHLNTQELDKLNYILDSKAHHIENGLLKSIHPILNKKQRIRFINYFDDWEVQ